MNHVRRAAYHNSTGATWLSNGDKARAFKSFKTSLKSLTQAIVHLEQDETAGQAAAAAASNETTDNVLSRAVPRSPYVIEQPQQQQQQQEGSNEEDAAKGGLVVSEEEGRPYLYNKGLVFYPNPTVTLEDLTFYSSVVVFNLILAYHHGKSSNDKKENCLQERDLTKLLRLYGLCLKLIGESARSSHFDCCNLMVAALNNKSVVHSELGQHAKARRMLYYVWDVMKYPERRPPLLETWEVEVRAELEEQAILHPAIYVAVCCNKLKSWDFWSSRSQQLQYLQRYSL